MAPLHLVFLRPTRFGVAAVLILGSLAGCKLYPDWVYVSSTPPGGAAQPAQTMPASVKAPAATALTGRVRVEVGDTLYAIARENGVPLRDLIAINSLAPPYTLRVGQILTLPATRTHRVAEGDTVYGISRLYGVDMSALVRLNGIREPYTIVVGQTLILPPATRSVRIEPAALSGAPTDANIDVVALEAPDRAPGEDARSDPAYDLTRAESGELAPMPSSPPSATDFAAVPASGSLFGWPAQGRVISSFGPKSDNLHNDGINIALAKGTPVHAARDGTIAYVGNELKGYGNLVLIRHDDNWISAYAHNDALLVERGQRVSRGDVIALSGDTGGVEQPQLHFELRREGVAVDPSRHLAGL